MNENDSPVREGSRSASSAEADAEETLGKQKTPDMFGKSLFVTSGREKRLTTLTDSPITKTLKRTPPAIDKS